jgi:hypothetical protein
VYCMRRGSLTKLDPKTEPIFHACVHVCASKALSRRRRRRTTNIVALVALLCRTCCTEFPGPIPLTITTAGIPSAMLIPDNVVRVPDPPQDVPVLVRTDCCAAPYSNFGIVTRPPPHCNHTPSRCSSRSWFVKRRWVVCARMNMPAREGVGRKGQVLDEVCLTRPGKGARLDFLPHLDLGARGSQSVPSNKRVIVFTEVIGQKLMREIDRLRYETGERAQVDNSACAERAVSRSIHVCK